MTNVQVENIDSVRRRLLVEIPAQDVSAELDKAFADLARTANVRGFRRGRVPRAVLERVAGERVRAEVHEKLVRDSFVDALRSERIDPVGQPEIATESAEPGQPLRYRATVEVRPEIVLGTYSGIEVERPLRAIDEDHVDRVLENMRQSAAVVEPIADRSVAAEGDVATIDYEAKIGDRVAGKGEDRLVEVGGGPEGEIGSHLPGVEVGGQSEFDVTYPDDHDNPELAGATLHFDVRLKGLGRRDVPPLDDAFAKAYGGCESVEELRGKVRERLEAQAAHDADAAVRNSLVGNLIAAHDIEVPEAMVRWRADGMVDEFIDNLGPRRPPKSREQELRAQLSESVLPQAREQVKASLLLEAIAEREKLEISDAEVEEEVDRFAQQAGAAEPRVRALYSDPRARAMLRVQRLRERALDRMVELAQIKTVEEKSSVAEGSGNG